MLLNTFIFTANLILVVAFVAAIAFIVLLVVVNINTHSQNNTLLKFSGFNTFNEFKTHLENTIIEGENNPKDETESEDISLEEQAVITKLNKSAKIGDRATLTINFTVKDKPLNVEVPVFLAERSSKGEMRFALDELNIMYNAIPYNQDGIIDNLKQMLIHWFDNDTTMITWRESKDLHLSLTLDEKKDIKSFLKFTTLPKEKQDKIKMILNI